MTSARLLLVEDEELNRVLVRAILARTASRPVGEAVLVEAPTLAIARDTLAADDPVDVVLLDLNLPDGSGLTLASEVADLTPQRRPQVVALTASVLPQERAAALAAGCDGFLDKPYSPVDLVRVIEEHLERRAAASSADR